MVKQPQRTDRCFIPTAGSALARVRFPVCAAQRRPPPPQQASETGSTESWPRCSSTATEEERGADGPSQPGGVGLEGGSEESDSKRARMEDDAAPPSRVPGSCAPAADVPPPGQQGAAENSEDSRAAELQGVGSLKVTIQQSSESREFGQTDRTAERQTGGLHCHVCDLTCRSLLLFQEHMAGPEHVKKLQEITHCIHLNTHTPQDRGRRRESQRWCDTCQTHFSGDVIIHRRTKRHKMCKQLCRPFCPVCGRHFRTPRKFVEHMKSSEHKQQVLLEEAQEEELITVDAVGCFEEEGEEEEEGAVVEEEVDVADEEEDAATKEEVAEEEEDKRRAEYDPSTACGSSFVVPVCGFMCQLCKKFFYSEAAARHAHCRTRTHYLHLQQHRRTCAAGTAQSESSELLQSI
ncbi:cdkn1a interacting zinc finger protein 1b isoform X3 [Simochromis diagramma]|uniref:cdkn1a interacting zinc finger protein 1b isoform X3 n=1 Tax=Simochromis diagramma TaxID=43689 RepID=UPI001A7EBD30|nr:cdkn1a interacting zinc finger protein 1b isoform X3 [Simochromis diagramma]